MKRLLTVSNLFPRPDRPTLGMFNAELFSELAKLVEVRNVCLVPEWNPLKWRKIREWTCPAGITLPTRYEPVFYLPYAGRSLSHATYGWNRRRWDTVISDCDAILTAWLYPDAVAVAGHASKAGVRTWILVQGSDTFHLECPVRKKAIMRACSQAEGIMCVWRGLARRLIDAGVPEQKVHVVPNGIDTEVFLPRKRSVACGQLECMPDVLKMDDKRRVVLFVGNLVPVKGPDVLLEAWGRVKGKYGGMGVSGYRGGKWEGERVTEFRQDNTPAVNPGQRTTGRDAEREHILVIVGDGPMRKQLERDATRMGVADSVVFLGSRPHDEVALWMNVADCLVVPSRSEGMPNVVLEALASGLPVVATDVGACVEMLENEPDCRIVSASSGNTADSMAESLVQVLSCRTDRSAMSNRHRNDTRGNQALTVCRLVSNG